MVKPSADRHARVLADLQAECAELDAVLDALGDGDWALPTPAEGWSISHQVAHLSWTEEAMLLSLTDAQQFRGLRDTQPSVDEAAASGARAGERTLSRWRASREALHAALRNASPSDRVEWFGPSMSVVTAATSRIMEVWAHGQDVIDALGATRRPTVRLRHVVHLGVLARDFGFSRHGLAVPADAFRVELAAPNGEVWVWGPAEAAERVTGSAYGFALLCTRRRPPSDVDVEASGAAARTWLQIAQAYADPPQRRSIS